MDAKVLGLTLDLFGTILIAYTAIRVHYRFWKEHKIDTRVFKTMRNEQIIGILGIILIIFGYISQLSTYLSF